MVWVVFWETTMPMLPGAEKRRLLEGGYLCMPFDALIVWSFERLNTCQSTKQLQSHLKLAIAEAHMAHMGGSLIWYFRLHTSRLHSSCPPTRFWSLKPGKPVSWRWVQSVSASWPVIYLWWTVQTNVQALSWLLKEQLTWDSDFQACFGALFSKRPDFDTDTDLAPYIWFLHQTSSQFWNQV